MSKKQTKQEKPKHFIENLIEDEETSEEEHNEIQEVSDQQLSTEDLKSQVVYNVPEEGYDTKDIEIDLQLQEIYSLAISSYKQQISNLDYVHPKNKSRAIEACSTLLNVALNAAKEKASLHHNIKKLEREKKPVEKEVNTQSRNELIKQLRSKSEKKNDKSMNTKE